jgi:hypothetical protein
MIFHPRFISLSISARVSHALKKLVESSKHGKVQRERNEVKSSKIYAKFFAESSEKL